MIPSPYSKDIDWQATYWSRSFIKHILQNYKTQVVEDFNTTLSLIDRSSRQKNQQRNLRIEWHQRSQGPDRCLQNIPSCNSTMYSLLSSPWHFLQIDYILGYKASLNKYKKTEIIPLHTVWPQKNKARPQQQNKWQKNLNI
jgi:hypothetical protein